MNRTTLHIAALWGGRGNPGAPCAEFPRKGAARAPAPLLPHGQLRHPSREDSTMTGIRGVIRPPYQITALEFAAGKLHLSALGGQITETVRFAATNGHPFLGSGAQYQGQALRHRRGGYLLGDPRPRSLGYRGAYQLGACDPHPPCSGVHRAGSGH
jgi:hypothetical protein